MAAMGEELDFGGNGRVSGARQGGLLQDRGRAYVARM